MESVSCTLASPSGDSRTAGLADLAPTLLKTSMFTQYLKKSDPFLIHRILFTSPRHRARCSRFLSNWFPGCEIRMTLTLRAEHSLHLVSWLLLPRVVTQSWWHHRVTWETFTNYQCLAPTPDHVSNSEVRIGARVVLMCIRVEDPGCSLSGLSLPITSSREEMRHL